MVYENMKDDIKNEYIYIYDNIMFIEDYIDRDK